MNMTSTDFKDMLLSNLALGLTFGGNLFIGRAPTKPDDCVTIFDAGGPPSDRTLTGARYYRDSVSIQVRNSSYVAGYELAELIEDFLMTQSQTIWNGVLYTLITSENGIITDNWDENSNNTFMINFTTQRTLLADTTFALTTTAGAGGTILESYTAEEIAAGTKVPLVAIADEGYAVDEITVNTIEETSNPFIVTMNSIVNVVVSFIASGLTLFMQIFDSIPTQIGNVWVWINSVGKDVEIGNCRVGTFNGSIYLSFIDLGGATISSWVGTSTPSKISDQRINVTAGYLASLTLSDGSVLVFNHGQRNIVVDIVNSNDATIIGAVLDTFWGSTADNINPYDSTLGATLYEYPNHLQCVTAGSSAYDETGGTDIAIPLYGEWICNFIKQGVVNENTALMMLTDTYPSSYQGTIGNRWSLLWNSDNVLYLVRQANGSGSPNVVFASSNIFLNADESYLFKVTRNETLNEFVTGAIGTWAIYAKGGTYINYTLVTAVTGSNPVTNNTYTTYKYFNVDTRLDTNINFAQISKDGNDYNLNSFVDGTGAYSVVPSSIMPICANVSYAITGFTRLGYFPAGSGALKGLPNKYYISGVDSIIAEGWYTIEELIAYEGTNVVITQDANTVSLFKVSI